MVKILSEDEQPSRSNSGGGGGSGSSSTISKYTRVEIPQDGEPFNLLPGSDFVKFSRQANELRRTLALIFAGTKEGKTHMSIFSTPGPHALINFDDRCDEIVEEADKAGGNIGVLKVPVPNVEKLGSEEEAMTMARGLLVTLQENIVKVVDASLDGQIRTIVFDTVSELSELASIAYLGVESKANQNWDIRKKKGALNTSLRRLMKELRRGKANVIMLSREQGIWSEGKEAKVIGQTYKCNEVFAESADWIAEYGLTVGFSKQFYLRVAHAGTPNGLECMGETFTDTDWGQWGPFAFVASRLYGTKKGVWKK